MSKDGEQLMIIFISFRIYVCDDDRQQISYR